MALLQTPQLVKLGVTMEFRDSLNKTAVQLQKNLDRSEQLNLPFKLLIRTTMSSSLAGRLTEDRSFALRLDKKHGPSIVEEKMLKK